MSVETIISALADLIDANLTGIKHIYKHTPEAIGPVPCARIFPAEGDLLGGPPGWTEDQHLLILEIRVARGHLPSAEALYRPYIDSVADLLAANPTISGTVQTLVPARGGTYMVPYKCGYLEGIGKDAVGTVDVGIIFEIRVKATGR